MKRPLGYGAILLAVGCVLTANWLPLVELEGTVWSLPLELLVQKALLGIATVAAGLGTYLLLKRWLVDGATNRRRGHDLRNVLRLSFAVATTIALLGVLTEQWLGVPFRSGSWASRSPSPSSNRCFPFWAGSTSSSSGPTRSVTASPSKARTVTSSTRTS